LALPSRTNPDTVYINTTLSSHFIFHIKPWKMDLTEGSETLANINQTPGKHTKVDTLNSIPNLGSDLEVCYSTELNWTPRRLVFHRKLLTVAFMSQQSKI
jgi:hypothetical protein